MQSLLKSLTKCIQSQRQTLRVQSLSGRKKVVLLDELYNAPHNANIRNTAWGVVNTLTERLDYHRTARKGGDSLMAGASGFDPVVTAEKNKIVKQVLTLAK